MIYRDFGNMVNKVSSFGIGCMRLPSKDGTVDVDESIKMIRYGIDNGVNYIDTAYFYHGGQSERIVGKALKDGYRSKVYLTTKLPVGGAKCYQDFVDIFNEQYSRLDTDYFDIYLLHGLNKNSFKKAVDLGVMDFMNSLKESGKIKYIGFSFHDDYAAFEEIIDYYDWDVCQIQLNFMDAEIQAGVKGLKYAASKNIPVIIMEPLKGGNLTKSIPPHIKDVYGHYNPVELAFKWVYNFKEVSVILSGVNNMSQLKHNIAIFNNAIANSLTDEEETIINNIKQLYDENTFVNCTGCEYCMPCPSNVNIPKIFDIVNTGKRFDNMSGMSMPYRNQLVKHGHGADLCIECGLCMKKCPQNIDIINKLKESHSFLK